MAGVSATHRGPKSELFLSQDISFLGRGRRSRLYLARNTTRICRRNPMASRLLDETAKGVYIISATPFTDSGDIDFASTDSLIDFYLESGVNGMTILGVLGEAPKLSNEESVAFTEHVLKRVNGRVQVVVGVSSAGNLNLKRLTDSVMSLG